MTMEVVTLIYDKLMNNPNDPLKGIEVYHSDLHYTHKHLQVVFGKEYNLTLRQLAEVMVEEGLSFKGRDVTLRDLITEVR